LFILGFGGFIPYESPSTLEPGVAEDRRENAPDELEKQSRETVQNAGKIK